MTALLPLTMPLGRPFDDLIPDDAELAATAFLARYQGRTLDAYRYDLRAFFQWAADEAIEVLGATRPQIECYVRAMEARGLAATTIDRRGSTVCGFYRFAHIDGRIPSNPAQYVRRPKVHPSDARGLDRSELGAFLFAAERFDQAHAALAVLLGLNGLRVSEACATNIEDLGFERGHRTLRIVGKGNKPAVIPLVPRTPRTIDLAIGERTAGPILLRRDGQRLDRRTAHRWVRSIARRAGLGQVQPQCCGPPSSCAHSMPAYRSERSRSPPATPILVRRRSTTIAARTSTSTPLTSWWPS
jgi:integrase/recombinase XerD